MWAPLVNGLIVIAVCGRDRWSTSIASLTTTDLLLPAGILQSRAGERIVGHVLGRGSSSSVSVGGGGRAGGGRAQRTGGCAAGLCGSRMRRRSAAPRACRGRCRG